MWQYALDGQQHFLSHGVSKWVNAAMFDTAVNIQRHFKKCDIMGYSLTPPFPQAIHKAPVFSGTFI